MPEPVKLRVLKDPHASFVYRVESEHAVLAEGEDWVDHSFHVDLETNILMVDGVEIRNGWCDCPNFKFKRQKKVDAGEVCRCKHIVRALEVYADAKVVEESNARKAAHSRMPKVSIFAGLERRVR
jgi:hypothetical protein